MSIKRKVLAIIVSVSMGSLLLLSLATMVSTLNIRDTTIAHSDTLEEKALKNSQNALENQLRQEMLDLAQDKALLVNEKFLTIENQTRRVADITGHIYTHKEQYHPKVIDYYGNGPQELPYLMTTPGVSLSAIREEAALAANVSDTLRQITVLDMGLTTSYIGGESGYVIIINRDFSGARITDFDLKGRDWYVQARDRGELYWTDVFADALGRGVGISCTIPFYEDSGGKRIFRGVAGSGALLTEVEGIVNRSVMDENGYGFLLDDKGQVIISPRETALRSADPARSVGENYLHSDNPELRDLARRMINREAGIMSLQMDGVDVYIAYSPLTAIDFSLGLVMNVNELMRPARAIRQDIMDFTREVVEKINGSFVSLLLIMALMNVISAVIAVILAFHLSRSFTDPIVKLCKGAEIIGNGDLTYQLEVKSHDEIEVLADAFNRMIRDIKTITGEKERLNGELTAAADIQNSMLPRIFPRFSQRSELSLYAKMTPAREVGGDFYDFFYLDQEETQFACIIADVSGKGVPAAMFMVIAKTLLKVHLSSSMDPEETLAAVNKILCEDNPQGMFVTVFICTLDLGTGKLVYANGGHNPPLISLSGQPYQFMKLEKGIPLGMFEESQYWRCEINLNAGDRLYLYTDGVNEAMNGKGEEFGNDRLLERTNSCRDLTPKKLDQAIRQDIAQFVEGEEQSDDITTLAIVYGGEEAEARARPCLPPPVFEQEAVFVAEFGHLEELVGWVETVLEHYDCSAKTCQQIAVVSEEIVVNIINYAYPEKPGDVTLRAGRAGEAVVLQFEDSGPPFNPLEWPDPDTNAAIEDRKVGGLGIYMVKKMTGQTRYERIDGKNLLTIVTF
jgi:sigma-B regulation protein RsbU (phosphoserine phosphatase)